MNNSNDLDGPDSEETFVDLHPERGFANSDRLGFILKITGRQVRSLATSGVLPRKADGPFAGQWEIMPSIDRWFAYKNAPPPAKSERLAAAQLRLIERRIAREDKSLISGDETIEVLDSLTRSFLWALDEVERLALEVVADPTRLPTVIDDTKAKIFAAAEVERRFIATGERHTDDDEE